MVTVKECLRGNEKSVRRTYKGHSVNTVTLTQKVITSDLREFFTLYTISFWILLGFITTK